jgi:hypothetical protein
VPSTKEVQGKSPGEEQSKYQEHLINLKQEHHQHHHQPLIKDSTGGRAVGAALGGAAAGSLENWGGACTGAGARGREVEATRGWASVRGGSVWAELLKAKIGRWC